MRDVILLITCSLDGYIADEDGNVDWLLGEDEYDFDSFLAKTDTLLMGHKTYKQVLDFGKWPYEGKECYVFTTQNPYPEHEKIREGILFSDDPVSVTENLIIGTGGNIWIVGGSSIISPLLNRGLISELRIAIQPIILGKGIPLFKDIKNSIRLYPISSEEYESGIVELAYHLHKE
ncbi:dihydrofolate reductase family protein [Methanolobus vulcani]|uniref:Dihydrofolate reductase n=1 Tax=Methanolobus vulcani TaxID=38026 RepID=A0A7Z8P4E8_9EURY|nr:dihydrofolate reductase family protein [Methanolobus vulcani]TQD24358.1 dihydrofolate reductase [Methanolobus vulcani]